jgi:hypothetical protein
MRKYRKYAPRGERRTRYMSLVMSPEETALLDQLTHSAFSKPVSKAVVIREALMTLWAFTNAAGPIEHDRRS